MAPARLDCCASVVVSGGSAGLSRANGVYGQVAMANAYLKADGKCSIEWSEGWVLWCFAGDDEVLTRSEWWAAAEPLQSHCAVDATGWTPLVLTCVSRSLPPLTPPPAPPGSLPWRNEMRHPRVVAPPPIPLRRLASPPMPPPLRPEVPVPRVAATICVAIAGEWHPHDLKLGLARQLGIWHGRLSEPRAVSGCSYGRSCGIDGYLFLPAAQQHLPPAARYSTIAVDLWDLNYRLGFSWLAARDLCADLLPDADAAEISARCRGCLPLPQHILAASSSSGPVVFGAFDLGTADDDLFSLSQLGLLGIPFWLALLGGAVALLQAFFTWSDPQTKRQADVRVALLEVELQDLHEEATVRSGLPSLRAFMRRRVDATRAMLIHRRGRDGDRSFQRLHEESEGCAQLTRRPSLAHSPPSPAHQLPSPAHQLPSPAHRPPSPAPRPPSPAHRPRTPALQLAGVGGHGQEHQVAACMLQRAGLALLARRLARRRTLRRRFERSLGGLSVLMTMCALLNVPWPHAWLCLYISLPGWSLASGRRSAHTDLAGTGDEAAAAPPAPSPLLLQAALIRRRRFLLRRLVPVASLILVWQAVPLKPLVGEDNVLASFSLQAAFVFLMLRVDDNLRGKSHNHCLTRGCGGLHEVLHKSYVAKRDEHETEIEVRVASELTLVQAWATLVLLMACAVQLVHLGIEPGEHADSSDGQHQRPQHERSERGAPRWALLRRRTPGLNRAHGFTPAAASDAGEGEGGWRRAFLWPVVPAVPVVALALPLAGRTVLGGAVGGCVGLLPMMPGLMKWLAADHCRTIEVLCNSSPWVLAPRLVGLVGFSLCVISAAVGAWVARTEGLHAISRLYTPRRDTDESKFVGIKREFVTGSPTEAAVGLFNFIDADEHTCRSKMRPDPQCTTIVEEWDALLAGMTAKLQEAMDEEAQRGASEAATQATARALHDLEMARSGHECLQYVLHAEAGSSTRSFQNGWMRDRAPHGQPLSSRQGKRFLDFVGEMQRNAKLDPGHVLALRL